MTEVEFNQNKKQALDRLIAQITRDRLYNDEVNRLDTLWSRPWVKEILTREDITWQDYNNLRDWCI